MPARRIVGSAKVPCLSAHETISVVTDDVFDTFFALAARWDLVELQRELSRAIGDLDESRRPYVPTNLSNALGMFLDSYGPPGVRWSEDP